MDGPPGTAYRPAPHRGPDGEGFHYFRGRSAGLGHRRLSIVDVACGAQPMANEDGTVWTTYNGEIYNHRDIRRELEGLGHRFRTAADTEVVVHGWEEWGPGIFERMNGIYALAIHDGRAGRERVILARDPVGVKPLYLGKGPPGWWFASELAAARDVGLVEQRVRAEALGEYLVYRFIPSPGTFYLNTWKIPPGHWCELPAGPPHSDPLFRRFETRFSPAVLPTSPGEWEEAIRDELTASVRRQLMSDVPVGSLLSGGVDSTVITRLMKEGLGDGPQSFAVGMTGGDNLGTDESALDVRVNRAGRQCAPAFPRNRPRAALVLADGEERNVAEQVVRGTDDPIQSRLLASPDPPGTRERPPARVRISSSIFAHTPVAAAPSSRQKVGNPELVRDVAPPSAASASSRLTTSSNGFAESN